MTSDDFGLGLIGDAWDKTSRHWDDDAARAFGTRQWTPLAGQSRACLAAYRALVEVLEEAERDTGY